MEERSEKKPLRSSSNKVKDINDTYLKNEGRKSAPDLEQENDQQEEGIKTEEYEEKEIVENDAEFEKMAKKIEQLEKENERLEDQAKRKAAELENFRRRTIKEKQDMLEFGNEKMLFKFLELLDDINNAVEAGKNTEDFDALFKGLKMINSKAEKLFQEQGVKQMDDPAGEKFDVNYHEAMMHTPHPEIPDGHVIQVLQPGYMINDKVLRHARVITSAGKEEK